MRYTHSHYITFLNGISIGLAVFCGAQERDQQTNTQTHRQTMLLRL